MNILELWEEEDALARQRRGHILVVDDEQDVRESIKRFLAFEGYDVTTAESGAVAIERAKSLELDLVLTDLRMPGMSGVETLIGLKQLHPELPVIVVTGYASDETASRCLQEGAYDYLQKPFELDSMLRLIEEAIEEGKGPRHQDS